MADYRQILKQYWGYSSFRPLQEDIIRSVADGKDTLALLPTGGGKSITFQVPAIAKDGVCLVITPLIALMKDQVQNLQKRGIKALAIYSGMTLHQIGIALDNAIFGNYKFLYLSPERLSTQIFRAKLPEMKVNLVAVDEAHCISQWGYDFRPSYLKIAQIREFLPDVPVLALTASAIPEVVVDIQEKLQFETKNVLKASFLRPNLFYIVRKVHDKYKYMLKIVNKTPDGGGIVYVRNRRKTKEIADFLNNNNISADYYHAGLSNEWRDYKENEWKSGRTRVMVSTNAFGMGIDKPDVRFVVHVDLPNSLEEYFQEAGRAGRDTKNAYAVTLYDGTDIGNLKRRIVNAFPEIKIIKQIYNLLGNFYQLPVGSGKGQAFDFKISDFVTKYKLSIVTVFNSLKFLEKEGYIEVTEHLYLPSKIHFIVGRDHLYKFQVANAKFDSFIKMLLRTYTGLFNEYIDINEDMLAKQAKTSKEIVCRYLQKLVKSSIIKYIPQKKTPLIIFTEERLSNELLHISKDNYDKRKKRHVKRINAVIDYAENKTVCRSSFLLSYFGEKNTVECGKCDFCRRNNELNLAVYEFNKIQRQALQLLEKKNLSLENLVDTLSEEKPACENYEEKALKTIQWMLDNRMIDYSIEKKLYPVKKK